MSAPRRNDPCPCGSRRRYKDCHGKLDGGEGADAALRRGLEAHRAGRIGEAESAYRQTLAQSPGHAAATHYLGLAAWQRGDVATAERLMREALAADSRVADFHNNLGLLLRDTGRADEAIERFRAALAIDPAWGEASSNLGLAFEAAGRREEAIAAYREALARAPRHAVVQQNLARTLLTVGSFEEAWQRYRWRLLAQGVVAHAPDEAARPLPPSLAGRRLILDAEQGLGDVLFFLRFAAELARRGARLGVRCDARLRSMLERTGLFELGVRDPGATLDASDAVAIGDLPWLLGMNDPARFPPPLALQPEAARVQRLRKTLDACGPRPWIALTWRGGVASLGPSRAQLKQVPVAELGAALRGIGATWIAVQRTPSTGELDQLREAIGAPVHDFTAANDELEEMLALLSVVDGYAGVSNANIYLRAATGGTFDVLVAHPPEWRWGAAGSRSPWFTAARLHREERARGWAAALASLRAALG